MLPALVVAFQWTGSLAVATGCWAVVIKTVDVAVNKAVDFLEESSSSKHI